MRTIDMNRITTGLKPKQRIASAIYRLKQAATVILLLLSTGCYHDVADIFGNDKQIAFSTDINQTRAASFTETGTTAYKTMGVFAANHGVAEFASTTSVDLMKNVEIERDSVSNGWYYSPATMWREAEKHSFFAYAPYNPAGLTFTNSGGIPTMNYTVPADITSQADLLVAVPQYNLTDNATGNVKLTMNHALTRVVFSARVLHSVPAGSSIKITKIELTKIANKATRPMAFEPTDLWTGQAGEENYTLTNATDGGLENVALTQTLVPIETATGNLFLLPQAFNTDDARLDITYQLDAETPITITKPIAHFLDEWRQSEAIRLLITVPNNVQPTDFTVDVSYEPWDNRNLVVNIPSDPFLDVTNVEVHTYDAAATRIYFYTNQPDTLNGKLNVFIDSIGREGLATGPTFNIYKELYALTSTDPAGAANFHFENKSGKGYFDLINVHTNTAGDRPNNGKKLLILKLHAGKLVRDIAVQPVITTEAAKGITVPYVGTFHRHNEMGERIVTWHLPETTAWTATIDNTIGNHTELCIDRLASPDFANNVLFSFAPRDAEGAKVSDEVRSVSGKGRVYFRVGWKSTSLPPAKNKIRYASINVTGTNVGGEGINAVTIYCRQGETEDPITGSTTIQFAVYNTAQPRTLAQYPSQVGMQYQWNRMKAWDPLTLTKPTGFPLYPGTPPYVYDITIPFSQENSACPEGYLYPNQKALDDMEIIINNYPNSFTWGYYADGFFDRRSINKSDNRVDASSLYVASAGYVLSAPGGTPKSIFLSTGGDRDSKGELINIGEQGVYWSQETTGTDGQVKVGIFNKTFSSNSVNTSHEMWHTHSLRCIKPAANEVWIIRFDANGGENAPLSITMPQSAGSVTIPATLPDNYWRDNYIFDKYTEAKDGKGISLSPGGVYSTSSSPALPLGTYTFYAQWKPNPYSYLDYRLYMTTTQQTDYLLGASASPSSYNGYVIGNNGNYYANKNAVMNTTSGEKAYPNLKITADFGEETWANAYKRCKDLTDDGGGWRLPRASEMMLINSGSPVTGLVGLLGILSDKSESPWTATEESNSFTFCVSWWLGLDVVDKGGHYTYRCVKELPR